MTDPLARYLDMLAEHNLRPFERIPWINPRTERVEPGVLGERVPVQWRVSQDEWDRLEAFVKGEYGWPAITGRSYLAGFPIDVDPELPPNSVILEPQR